MTIINKQKKETTTAKVLRMLNEADDFLTMDQVVSSSRRSRKNVWSALHNLLNYKAVGFVKQDDELYWYARPQDDTRLRVFLEIVSEFTRKPKRKKPQT